MVAFGDRGQSDRFSDRYANQTGRRQVSFPCETCIFDKLWRDVLVIACRLGNQNGGTEFQHTSGRDIVGLPDDIGRRVEACGDVLDFLTRAGDLIGRP